MSNYSDPFFQVPQTAHTTTQGPIDLPILYFDVSTLLAFFVTNRDAVEAKLDGTGLRPALTIGGRALDALLGRETEGIPADGGSGEQR